MALNDEFWTEQQKLAIQTVGRSVLVGAAAGSGKTAVLARRCAYLVCEAPPEWRCEVDELLVVTFTEAAASEMRTRIGRAIRDRLAEQPDDPRLRFQLAALDGAAISTIHAFCKKTLTRWFAAADVDPDFELLDQDEQLLFQQEAVERVFAELYEDAGPEGERFRRFVDVYGEGRDRAIADRVIWLAEYLNSVVDPRAWLSRARDWVTVQNGGELPPGVAETVGRRLRNELHWQHRDCVRAVELIRRRYGSAAHVADTLQEHADRLADWAGRAGSHQPPSLDELTTPIREYKFPANRGGPRLAKDAPDQLRRERDTAGAWHKRVRESFEARLQSRWCLFSESEMGEGLARVAPQVGTLIGLVERFADRYRLLKAQQARLDFADLERKTLELLGADQGRNEVAHSLRQRFRYVCVDEFQDVNPVQEHIIRAVSGEAWPDREDNLFCVGDIKQSIYRFRLAEPGIFAGRRERFVADSQAGLFAPLGDNFRSRTGVINGVNRVFERVMSGALGPITYDRDAELRPGLEYPAPDRAFPCVEMHLLERAVGGESAASGRSGGATDLAADWEVIEREAYWVGRRILQLMGREPGHPRVRVCLKPAAPGEPMPTEPIDFKHLVILLRSPRHKAEALVRVLSSMGVPVHAELATGYFESTEVRDVLALLSLLDNRRQDIPLAAVMRSPLFGPRFDESELVRLRSFDRERAFHESFELYARKGPDADLAARCGSLGRLLDRYRALVRRRPVAEALWMIYAETGCLSYVAGLPGGRQRRANLIRLHERAGQFGTFARQGLYRFGQFIRRLEESGRDLGAALPASESDNVIRIMSMHGSKGLEFPVVVLPDLAKTFNLEDARGRIVVSRDCFIGPKVVDDELHVEYPSVAHALAADDVEVQTRAEEMRVLYVAMTRARERLIMVGSERLGRVGREPLAAEWAGHAGPLPPLTISGANSYLDWLLPALACQRESPEASFPEWLQMTDHEAEEIRNWRLPGETSAGRRAKRSRYADVPPLPADEPRDGDHASVEQILGRVRESYEHNALTAVPAVLAVTELKRRYEATRDLDDQTRELAYALPYRRARQEARGAASADTLARPTGDRDVAAERGTVTHLFLQHVDPAATTDPDQLHAEVESLIGRGLFTRDQSELIDRQAVLWFFRTPLGRQMRQAGGNLHREVMFTSSVRPDSFDPAVKSTDERDAVLIRGVIDALLISADGCQVIDYKTDDIGREEMASRAETYRSQMDLYARAAGELTRGPVTHRWLVFLTPRQLFELAPL